MQYKSQVDSVAVEETQTGLSRCGRGGGHNLERNSHAEDENHSFTVYLQDETVLMTIVKNNKTSHYSFLNFIFLDYSRRINNFKTVENI